jgi:Trypsin-co-occurring domain 2
MENQIGLQEAIEAVRTELIGAMHSGEKQEIQFRVGSVQLEFEVVVTKEAEGKAGVRFWVVEAGAGGKLSSAATHTVRVALEPVTRDGKQVAVGSTESGKPS